MGREWQHQRRSRVADESGATQSGTESALGKPPSGRTIFAVVALGSHAKLGAFRPPPEE